MNIAYSPQPYSSLPRPIERKCSRLIALVFLCRTLSLAVISMPVVDTSKKRIGIIFACGQMRFFSGLLDIMFKLPFCQIVLMTGHY